MKKLLLVLSILFTIVTFAGVIFVLKFNGTVNAGYAVIPMGISMACLAGYRVCKTKEK